MGECLFSCYPMLARRSPYHKTMPATALVLYAYWPDISFDKSYYLNTHISLAEKTWTIYELPGWHITRFTSNPGGLKPPHLICANLEGKNGAI